MVGAFCNGGDMCCGPFSVGMWSGAAISFTGMWMIAFVPDKAMVYLALGLMPFVVEVLPAAMRPNIEWRGGPLLPRGATPLIRAFVGVGGAVLSIFFP